MSKFSNFVQWTEGNLVSGLLIIWDSGLTFLPVNFSL